MHIYKYIYKICNNSSFYELPNEALGLFTNLQSILVYQQKKKLTIYSNSCPQASATYLSIKMTSNVSERAIKDRCSLNNSIIYVASKFT